MTGQPRWLVRSGPAHAGVRLYCFPHGGGSAGEFAGWARRLPGVEVCALQLPGRAARLREEPFTAIEPLVEAIIRNVAFTGPYALFGHSLGALVAFETAHALRVAGAPEPGLFVASSFPAPHLPRTAPPVARLADDAFLDEVERRHGGLPPEALRDPELRAITIRQLRADYEMVETYEYKPKQPLNNPVAIFAGTDEELPDDQVLGWQEHAIDPVQPHRFTGGHFYFRQDHSLPLRTLSRLIRQNARSTS